MLILSVNEQAYSFILVVIVGVILGVIYDIFRLIRKYINHKNIFIHIEDLVYWLICVFVCFLILLYKDFGNVRVFSFIGLSIGMITYWLLASRYFIMLIDKIIFIICKIFNITIVPVSKPIKNKVVKSTTKINYKKKIVLNKSKSYYNIKKRKLVKQYKLIKNKK